MPALPKSPFGVWLRPWLCLLFLATSGWFSTAAAQLPPKAADAGEPITGPDRYADLPNLLINGDFEEGEDRPLGWQQIDGLSSFWIDDPEGKRGKVIKLDTDVTQKQAYSWWFKLTQENAPVRNAPAKEPTVEPKYDTLAGLDGVWFWSDPVEIQKGKEYWLTADVKGPGMKIFMRGYPQAPDLAFGADEGAWIGHLQKLRGEFQNERGRKAFIKKYTWDSWMRAGGSEQWQTYSRREKTFAPTKVTPNVRYLRVMLYPYWPPGVYYIDNVRLVEVPTLPTE